MEKDTSHLFDHLAELRVGPREFHGEPIDIRLRRCFSIDADSFASAISIARRDKIYLDTSLLAHGLITEDELYRGMARGLSLPFVEGYFDIKLGFPFEVMLASGYARRPDGIVVAAPRGAHFEDLMVRLFSDDPAPPMMITTPANFRKHLLLKFGKSEADHAVEKLSSSLPEFSARKTAWLPFILLILTLPCLYLVAWGTDPHIWTFGLYSFSALISVPSLMMKAAFLLAGRSPVTLTTLSDADLPLYTIMLPLYRETESAINLLNHIVALDYPRSKLQILLLVEEHDRETIDKISSCTSMPCLEIIACPRGSPQTKPRALAIGLTYARGELIVVYDAEDIPDHQQLKKAAAFFAQSPPEVACVQASLAIYNGADSWLTRMFSIEYAILFDVIVPGMARLAAPIPLGGTSNHLRRHALDAVKGWDPWNVTEDADLGLRLKYFGYETRWLPSTTLEEAPHEFRIWFAQRTRWFKGWMQTAIVHVGRRHALTSDSQWRDRLSVMLIATISFMTALYHPLVMIMLTEIVFGSKGIVTLLSTDHISVIVALILLIIHACLSSVLVICGGHRRGLRLRMTDFILQAPYSLLRTAAAWRAAFELMVAPTLWHKTPHGRARSFEPPV